MITLKPTCPHCGKLTPYESDRDYIFMARVTCTQCGEEFVVSKNVVLKPLDYEKQRAREAVGR